jgi:hypothetical protein
MLNNKVKTLVLLSILAIGILATRSTVYSAVPPDWTIKLTATTSSYSSISTFGLSNSATNGFDLNYDALAYPDPPTGVNSCFFYPNNPTSPVNLQELSTSIVSTDTYWEYQVRTIGISGTTSITWSDASGVPGKYYIYLEDSNGNTLANLRTDTQYSFSADPNTAYSFKIHLVLNSTNVTAWYWNSNTTIQSVAKGDVYGDGKAEIITGGYFNDGIRNVAQLIVWNGATLQVKRLTSWYWTGDTKINSVALGDVDGDGQVEVVTGGSFNDGARSVAQLIVWNGATLQVKRLTSWYWTGDTTINSVALGDVDGDGQVEVVTGGSFFDGARDVAQLIEWSGANLAVDRLTSWYWTGNTVINSVAIGNVDGDGQVEVVTGGSFNDGIRDVAQLIEWNGANLAVDRLTGWYWTGNTVVNSVAVGDVDGDGQIEVVTGGVFHDGTRDVAQLIEWNGTNFN